MLLECFPKYRACFYVCFEHYHRGNCPYEIICLAHRLDLRHYRSRAVMARVCQVCCKHSAVFQHQGWYRDLGEQRLEAPVWFEKLLCLLHFNIEYLFAQLLSCVRLYDPMDCSLPGSSVHGILQARILEWVAVSSSRGSSQPRIEPVSPVSLALAGRFFTTSATFSIEYPQIKCVLFCLLMENIKLQYHQCKPFLRTYYQARHSEIQKSYSRLNLERTRLGFKKYKK